MNDDKLVLEQAVLRLAHNRQKERLRRFAFEEVLGLPEVQKYYPKGANDSFVPDELCLCLNELRDDGLIVQHDINFRQGADGYWSGGLRNNPAISITELGRKKIQPTLVSDRRAIERELLELVHEQQVVEGHRRVPWEMVLSLPTVEAQIHHADEIPDDLIRILTELGEDRYLLIHDITITPLLGNEWAVGVGRNPSISLTNEGRFWMANQVAKDRVAIPPTHNGKDHNGLLVNPTAFKTPRDRSHSETGLLVAVMMPFRKEFDGVYQTIESACRRLGFTARKADDMWLDQVIIQDIFTLLYQADIVIVDFSGSNPNVMYETGIAHTLGKEVIPLAQNIESDVPFDMRHRRVLAYVANKQGLEDMGNKLFSKLRQYLPK